MDYGNFVLIMDIDLRRYTVERFFSFFEYLISADQKSLL